MKKIWIFDLDGTVLDTLGTIGECANEMLTRRGFESLPLESYRLFVGNGAWNLTRLIAESTGMNKEEHESFYQEYCRHYDENPIGSTVPFPGMPEFLHHLKSRGIKLAILTNKPDATAQTVIREIYGSDLFDIVLGQRYDYRRKPDPEGMFLILEALGIKPEDAIYLGDMSVDIETGRNAGVETVTVAWGFRSREELEEFKPDRIVDRVEELYGLIDEE